MIRILSPVMYRVRPWKNGAGTTTDLAAHPEGAGWDDFDWRISIADIGVSGPFSPFPGIDRSILLLECPPESAMTLTIDGVSTALAPQVFIGFAGESQVEGTLQGKAVRDFNVMSRRGVVAHRCGCKAIADKEWFRMGGATTRFVYVVAGAATLLSGSAPPRAVAAGESLLVSGDDALNLRSDPEGARLVWAEFSQGAAA